MSERKYFDINEGLAKTSHDMMSMWDYQQGSKTAEYRGYCDEAYALAEEIAQKRPREAERAWRIAEAYSRRMAANLNAASRIGCMCPSVLVSGAGNFPVKKKEKQIAAMDRNMEEYREIQGYLDKLRRILHGKEVIRADDEDAIIRLEEKLAGLEEKQEFMKAVNAYYKKHKTLKGCPELTDEQAEKVEAAMADDWRVDKKPFASFQITNNGANIRSTRERLDRLKKEKSRESSETRYEELSLTVKEDVEDMRIRLYFDGKPDEETRKLLKAWAFKWSPSQSAWQRQLNNNGRYATRQVLKKLKEMEGIADEE